MRIVVRIVAVFTVLLSMGLMAVSAYAAKTAPLSVPASVKPPVSEVESTIRTPRTDRGQQVAPKPVATKRPPTPTPVHISNPTLRFAAPDGTAGAGLHSTAGQSLSTGVVRVWQVPSLRSGSFTPGGFGPGEIPPDQLFAMQQTGAAFDLPWQLLAAIARVESNFGNNMSTSSAGAIGYGQFLPEEWALYGAGGNPYDYNDALLAMARYLVTAGAPADIPDAVYAYNHSWEYVEAVLSYASAYGYASTTSSASLIWPVLGPISSYFGPDHPLGIDIDQSATPDAPVWAAQSGTVVFAGGDPCCSYGNYVIVDNGDGVATLYGHLSAIAVQQGQHVSQGETLGVVGCTGHCSGPHLHFEVIVNGVREDPLGYLPGGY